MNALGILAIDEGSRFESLLICCRKGTDIDCTFEQGLGGPRDWTRGWDPNSGEVVNMPVRQVYNDYRYNINKTARVKTKE